MRYSKSHKEQTRRRLLDNGREMVKKGGFEAASVEALMGAIGLTGGAFYGHFPSKRDLFKAVIEEEIENSCAMLAGDDASGDAGAKYLRGYLSNYHSLHPEAGCVLPTLSAEIARADEAVRGVVERGLKRIQKDWQTRLNDADAAWALIAQCVGSVLLARMMAGEAARKELLAASRRYLQHAHAAALGATAEGSPQAMPKARAKREAENSESQAVAVAGIKKAGKTLARKTPLGKAPKTKSSKTKSPGTKSPGTSTARKSAARTNTAQASTTQASTAHTDAVQPQGRQPAARPAHEGAVLAKRRTGRRTVGGAAGD